MHRPNALLAAMSFACLGCIANAAGPLTKNCKANFGNGQVIFNTPSPTVLAEFLAIAKDPSREPGLRERLWQPHGAEARSVDWGVLQYDAVQDTDEIAAALRADPVLKARGLTHASANTTAHCFSALPPATPVTVTEYYNRHLDHYFLSSSEQENAVIDSGGAGPGWERTGEIFPAIKADYCYNAYPVFRFYAAGPSSHFFTVDPEECGLVRNRDPGWQYEGEAFGAARPANGSCPGRTRPVYRLYNNRWTANDSNHRFVTRSDLYEAMQARGWIGEGLAFCLAARGDDTWLPP